MADLSLFLTEVGELEDSVARLCWIASAAHACGDYPRRDDAVDLAAELAQGLADRVS